MVGNAIDIVAPAAKVCVLDDVKRYKRRNEHDGEERHADENEEPLARQIPSAKEDVWNKDNGGYHA